SGAAFLTSFDSNAVKIVYFLNGEKGLSWSGNYEIMGSMLALSFLIFLFFNYLQIHRKAPPQLKQHSRLLLVSGVLLILSPITSGFPLNADGITLHNIIPGIFSFVVAVGMLLMSIVLISQPKLAFVLPFKALRLTVIHEEEGIALYSHTWSIGEDMIENGLYSGMLQGISMIIKESIKRGHIRQIQMDDAILILYRRIEKPIFCAIAATNFSPSLQNALELFTDKFIEEFSSEFSSPHDISKFDDASRLIEDYFSFVP
ncbi:MAG: hypothetical protein ACFFBD_13580, partial [Candidatus Hodarchaeota archaeon]